ncbi:hypothetical protein QBC32DRAFT_101148 [Pseudoneurospora amorphoporcata]|uniref:Uncharacterized protein n=1 Tax=Pseudoneurospora amorphoporcata TaxID=241081 RepID=A0AAN6NZR0_9PEZI|nr:hypothetical protein QBC32DRAFT_101148 [Pseudoneurospora amorphoporcata]
MAAITARPATMETANLHTPGRGQPQQPQSQTSPSSSVPASPTLSNPDMILPDDPYYGHGNSPDSEIDARIRSKFMMWKSAQAAVTATSDLHKMFAVNSAQLGYDQQNGHGSSAPLTPTTPIIYGNGTILSDIGEVTEVESTIGRPSPTRHRGPATHRRNDSIDAVLRSASPVTGQSGLAKKLKPSLTTQKERRMSTESTSTITSITMEDRPAFLVDMNIDDAASVDDSVFQGDDEESMASSYVEGTIPRDRNRLGVAESENGDRLSTYSTTALSRRAEAILANAKKRLTTMEGNLSRARSSLHYTAPSLPSDGTPSPPQRTASASNRINGRRSSSANYSGHTRMTSDIAMRNGLPYRISIQRSHSAMGSHGGNNRQSITASKSAEAIRGGWEDDAHRQTYNILTGITLRPDGTAPDDENESPIHSYHGTAYGSDHSSGSSRDILSTPAPTSQMRDIKHQMKDLKGKISSLREQARVDSIKRQSVQSLRTPSPFTHAQVDQWFTETPSARNSEIFTPEYLDRNPWNGEQDSSLDGEHPGSYGHLRGNLDSEEDSYAEEDGDISGSFESAIDHFPEPASATVNKKMFGEEEDNYDAFTENGDEEFEDAQELDDDQMSVGGESLYHDTVQHQVSHEDREDAFDYEHFFLHSAMGTLSQQCMARRGSETSYTSEDSVETTRGPITDENTRMNGGGSDSRSINFHSRSRRGSVNSISTIETFRTAQEGRPRRYYNEADDSISEEVYEEYPYEDEYTPELESGGKRKSASFSAGTGNSRTNSRARGSTISNIKSFSTGTIRSNRESFLSVNEEGSGPDTQKSNNRNSGLFIRRGAVSAAASAPNLEHRPSVSSLGSAGSGTNRSFPLVPNKARNRGNTASTVVPANNTAVSTPETVYLTPDQELRSISSVLLSETASVCDQQQHETKTENQNQLRSDSRLTSSSISLNNPNNNSAALQALLREDKYLVERLVASLGKCVLGLTENGRASAESRMYRRRIDMARKILEGFEDGQQ